MHKCTVCGRLFIEAWQLDDHQSEAHSGAANPAEPDTSELESSLVKKTQEEERARKRTRGPYRKSHGT